MKIFAALTLSAVCAAGLAGCGAAANANLVNTTNKTNVNTNVSNVAVVVNNNSNVVANSSNGAMNSNVARTDYDKDRAKYEANKGESKIGQGANDSWLWFKTKTALATSNDLRDSTINVDVENDVITLRGTVASAAQKTQAETVAKGIEGVKSVKNDLKVQAGDSMTNQMVNGNSSTKATNANSSHK